MPIKVLFIVNDLGIGGVQRLTVDFANNLDKKKFEISVATLLSRENSFFYKDQLENDVKYHSFSFKDFYDWARWLELYRFLRHNEFDIVFTQLFMADLIGRLTAFFSGTPLIITEIQNITAGLPKKFIYINRILSLITGACISTTPAITKYAVEVIKFPPKKIIEVPTNAVDAKKFLAKFDKAAIRRSLGLPEDAKVIINIGRAVEQKGQKFIIRSAPEILAAEPNAYFIIVGSGDQLESLRTEANDLGISARIKCLGSRKDTPELLAASDVFVFPSIWEGQGLILFEAIFSRLPIIASNVGGIPDIIKNGETGLLTEPGDCAAIVAGIARLLKDGDLREKLTTEAFARFGDRTIENSVEKLADAFSNLLERQSK